MIESCSMSKEMVEGKGIIKPGASLIKDLKKFHKKRSAEEGIRKNAVLGFRIEQLNSMITDQVYSFGHLENLDVTIVDIVGGEHDITNIDPLLGALLPSKVNNISVPGINSKIYPTKYDGLYIEREAIFVDTLGHTNVYSLVGKNKISPKPGK